MAEALPLAELRRLHEMATPGPWYSGPRQSIGGDLIADIGAYGAVWCETPLGLEAGEGADVADAAAIAAYHTAMPALLAIAEAADRLAKGRAAYERAEDIWESQIARHAAAEALEELVSAVATLATAEEVTDG